MLENTFIFLLLTALSSLAANALSQGVGGSTSLISTSNSQRALIEASGKKSGNNANSSALSWRALTSEQKLALKPLGSHWNTLGDTQRRKWIALSVNFQTLSPEEQEKLHSRMTDWIFLSQQQRSQARLNFSQSKQLPQSHKAATWQAYQALSQEEKQKLARIETSKNIASVAPAKKGAPQKIASASINIQSPNKFAHPVTVGLELNHATLLPNIQPKADLVIVPKIN
jgi:hypothetical protein